MTRGLRVSTMHKPTYRWLIIAAALSANVTARSIKKAPTKAEQQLQNEPDKRGTALMMLAYAFIACLIPPVIACLWSCISDPTLPIVLKLLWLRLRELVGFPVPSEKEFFDELRRERDEQLRQNRAIKNPQPTDDRGPSARGSSAAHRGPPAGPQSSPRTSPAAYSSAVRASGVQAGSALVGSGVEGSAASDYPPMTQAERMRQRFFDRQPILS